MYVCMYACMHVSLYVCMYVCRYVFMYVCMYEIMRVPEPCKAPVYVCINKLTCVHGLEALPWSCSRKLHSITCFHTHTHTYIYTYVYICMYVIHIWEHAQEMTLNYEF
jgi:hypothetical protein